MMKKTPHLLYCKQAVALFIAFLILFTLPVSTVSAAQTSSESPLSAETGTPQQVPVTGTMATPSDAVSEDDISDAAASDSETPPEASSALPSAEESEPLPDNSDTAGTWAYAGQQLTFVDLLWRSAPVAGVDAVFIGNTESTVVSMTAGERGLFTVTIPSGPYDRVAFYPAGQADTAQPLGGIWRLDGQADDTAAAVNFVPDTLSAFYYDSGDSPSYWGPAPGNDSDTALMTLANPQPGNPQPGDQLYFVNLHKLKGDETDPLVTVEARFIQLPHDGTDSPNWTNGKQYIGRTMYEVRDGVYVVPFPQEITESSSTNTSGYLYEEVAFNLTRQSGYKDPFNRHYNFRDLKHASQMPETWGTPGYFGYIAGTMDAYYYNTDVEDSYWNAHPSNADASIHSQMVYFDTKDYGATEEQKIGNLYLRWDGMPTSYLDYQYDQNYGFLLSSRTNTEGVFYFRMPTGQNNLSENTVFTLTYVIEAGSSHAGTHTFLFTYVPRSGFDCLMLDYLWEDTGEVWGNYGAEPADPDTTRVYFNNAVTAFGKIQVLFGTKKEDGSYTWVSGQEASDATWAKDHRAYAEGYESWARGWLYMEALDPAERVEGHAIPNNVWAFEGVPDTYTHVMFRGALNADADDGKGNNFWFSPPLEISTAYSYPCFFGYRYLDESSYGQAKDDVTLESHDHRVLNGGWGSLVQQYSLGDASMDVPQGSGFVNQNDVYYATTSLYDYYSMWEQSGESSTKNTYLSQYDSSRNLPNLWGTQGLLWNLAVSEYFDQKDTSANQAQPLYFGSGGSMVEGGWGSLLTGAYSNYGKQYADHLYNFTNHANQWTADTGARTGLLDQRLNSDGDATIQGLTVPYFSESFLRGDNSMNVTLGNAYKDLRFPFHQVTDSNDEYYGYWQFDSSKDGLRLEQDPDGSYYLDDTTDPVIMYDPVAGVNRKSYLPFNDATSDGTGIDETKLNYMFGQRVDLTFTVPEGGQVNMAAPGEAEKMKDVIFEFQGDDDCWIFIDGQLVLDMGGIHDAVRGTINFKSKEWKILRNLDANDTPGSTEGPGVLDKQGTFHLTDTADGTHTLTMLYFERGLYASNLKLTFNFPQQNHLRVTKTVDESNVDPLFSDAMDNLGSFEIHMDTMATSGQSLAVKDSAGYVKTETLVFYEPEANGTSTPQAPAGGCAEVQADTTGKYLNITQPNGWDSGQQPAENQLLTLTPQSGTIALDKYAFLELELYNATADNRGAELYIQLKDQSGKTVTASARTVGYLGEANLFLPNAQSLIRIDLNSLIAADPAFDRTKVTAVRIGLQKGTGAGSEDTDHYRLYRASFGTQWNLVLSTGFSVGDDQISDYGSIAANDYQPANGAWYTRQTTGEGGNVTESVASVVQNGSLSLANGQTAVFTDKFRVGSYLLLEENVDTNLFETSWSIRESGQPVSFNSLLPDRPNVSTIVNPDWGFTFGENPLENRSGVTPYDGRSVSNTPRPDGTEKLGFVYRSYRYPDNNENLPVDLEVIFHNKMRTGNFTIQKQLDATMEVGGRYPVGVYTFDIYYTNVGGRGLEQFLPTQPVVDGLGDHYIHQVVQITTDGDTGRGEFVMEGVPAGTRYIIRERPANGATLVGLEATGGDSDTIPSPVKGVAATTEGAPDYSKAYIQDNTYLLEETQTEKDYPLYTFTNQNKPFYMKIEKVWQGDPPTNVEAIHIQVQRRKAGSQSDTDWKNVTSDFFGDELNEIVLLPDENGNWSTAQSEYVLPSEGTVPGNAQEGYLYEYRIVELGVGEGFLASYRVEYTQVDGGTTDDDHLIVTYQAHNIPTGLTLQKNWLDNQNRDDTRPNAVRVRLQRSLDYDPENPTANATWETVNETGQTDPEAFIELRAPDWSYSLKGLSASGMVGEESKPYYYRLQEVQVQNKDALWVPIESQDTYEPAYSLPVTLGQAAALTVENALKTAKIQVIKQDAQDANKLLSGAEFLLQRLMQTADGEWIVDTAWSAQTGTTDSTGTCTFTELRPGRYRLTETQAPEGYQASLTPTDITLGAEHLNDTVKITVQNSKPLPFTFTKVAAEDNQKSLAGAHFALYALVCGDTNHTHTELLDPDSPSPCWNKVTADDVVSGADGVVTFQDLAAGTYRLVETKAPGGYALPAGQWQVTLQVDGATKLVGINNPPAFLEDGNVLKLTNRKPLTMPSSGGPGVPLASALGVLMMGAGLLLMGKQLQNKRKKTAKK